METVQKETKIHGKPDFPFMVYNSFIPQIFKYFPVHWHEEFEIILVMSGHMRVSVENNEYLCGPDDIVIIPPDHIHGMHQEGKEYCHYCNILFTFSLLESDEKSVVYQKYLKSFYDGEIKSFLLPAGCDLNDSIIDEVRDLFERRHEKYISDELKIKADLYNILFNIQKIVSRKSSEYETLENWIKKVKPILSYVEKNYTEEISVEQAAEMCSLSKSHFMKIFKKVSGKSFLDYIKNCRLENACYQITETDENISDIGIKCGFNNFSYFIRSFKENFGLSPLQYRKKAIEDRKKKAPDEKRS